MKVTKAAARPSKPASAEYFTGTVWMNEVVAAGGPSRLNAALVTFNPGARTAWHTHPIGQTLYVTSGVGRVQKERHTITYRLKDLERRLDPSHFIRLGRGTLANGARHKTRCEVRSRL